MDKVFAVADQVGPIEFKKHVAANWSVPLSGVLNLNHPKAVLAGLIDRKEPIKLFVYTLKHPKYGTYLIDSGISASFADAKNNPDISFVVKKVMNISALEVLLATKDLARSENSIAGVFLSHIHMDHILGLSEIDSSIPVYVGPGEVASKTMEHAVTRGTTNRLLENIPALHEWQFDEGGVIDVFGDGSLWAIHSPGHSPGSTAYLAHTTSGPQLMIGDITHTRWGWDNNVEPGTYSKDGDMGVASLEKLKSLVASNPNITVHPGHQE